VLEVVAVGVPVPILMKHAVVARTRITTVSLLSALVVAALVPEIVTVWVVEGARAWIAWLKRSFARYAVVVIFIPRKGEGALTPSRYLI
jgi:uncharacterized protein YacL